MVPDGAAPSVKAEGLCFAYKKKRILQRFNLTVPSGINFLLGPNGAGKTTALRLFATVTRPQGGDLAILGHDPRGRAQLRTIRAETGYLPQVMGYPRGFRVREFLEYCAWLKSVPAQSVSGRITSVATKLTLTEYLGNKMRTLSGGTLRRVGIAQSLIHQPRLVILDEPTAGLDPQQRIQLRGLIRDIAPRTSVIVSTHLVEDVAALADNVTVIADGRVVFHDTVNELASLGSAGADGETPLERGYLAVLSDGAAARNPPDGRQW